MKAGILLMTMTVILIFTGDLSLMNLSVVKADEAGTLEALFIDEPDVKADETGASLFIDELDVNDEAQTAAQVAEHYNDHFITEHDMEVTFDADIIRHGEPEAIVKTIPHTFTAEEVKHWSEVLFDGNPIYEVNTRKTTEELLELIDQYQNMLDALDPEVEPELYEIRQELYPKEIAIYESMLPDAEDSYESKEPDWTFKRDAFRSAYVEGRGYDSEDELNEEIQVYSEINGHTAYVDCVSRTKEDFVMNRFQFWVEDSYQEEQIEETPEEVQAIVMEQLKEMGLSDRWVIKSCKLKHQNDQRNKEKQLSVILNGGYYYDLEFVSQYAGCETLTQFYMFSDADLTSYSYRNEFEKLQIQYSNGRIVYMDYMNPLETTEEAETDFTVIDYEEATACFLEEIQSGEYCDRFYNQFGQYPLSIRIKVTSIEYGLLRIRTSQEEALYQMIPVWSFNGRMTRYYGAETVSTPMYGEEEFLMAINAIDRSVIRKEEGRR